MIRILYVDDDPDLREIAGMSLGLDPEIEVKLCDSGPSALDVLRSWQPDLILLDVMMPEMDGPATFRAIQESDAGTIPVAFITARSQSRDIEFLIELGACGIITKPFDAIHLATQVRALIDGR